MEKREILKETELFVLDMDGTFYLDTDVLDGALDFLEEVKKAGKRYVFFTNNSSKSPKTYIDKLAKMGCYIKRNQIITSGDVMIQYLKEYYPEKKVYLVGTPIKIVSTVRPVRFSRGAAFSGHCPASSSGMLSISRIS